MKFNADRILFIPLNINGKTYKQYVVLDSLHYARWTKQHTSNVNI